MKEVSKQRSPDHERAAPAMDGALRESESRLRAILHCAGEAIYGVDLEGRCTFANATCARLLGYESPEDLIGHNMHRLIHHTRPDRTPYPLEACRIYEAFQRGEGTHVDDELLWRRDGTSFAAEYRSYPLWIRGRLQGAVVTFSDISERLRAEEERRALEARVQASQKRESLEVLAGGVAHDFNNLLTVILGNAQVACAEPGLSEASRRAFAQIEEAARRAAELAHQMLVFAGKVGALPRSADLSTLVQGMHDLLQASISKRVRLTMELAENLPKTRVDATQLRQVLLNLVTNAAEAYESHGGWVLLRTGVEHCDAAFLSTLRLGEGLPAGDYVFLEARDEARGMDAETQARAFDPFFSTKFTGRGLGLAATLGIVRAHRGAIALESQPGRGTRIRIYLPAESHSQVEESPEEIADAQRILATPAEAGPEVLVVDDEPAVRELAADVLERAGFAVRSAADADEALGILAGDAERIALLLLDLTMPGLASEEALQQVRRRWPEIAILVTSGYPEGDLAARFPSGEVAFLQKPWEPGMLVQRVRDLTRR